MKRKVLNSSGVKSHRKAITLIWNKKKIKKGLKNKMDRIRISFKKNTNWREVKTKENKKRVIKEETIKTNKEKINQQDNSSIRMQTVMPPHCKKMIKNR